MATIKKISTTTVGEVVEQMGHLHIASEMKNGIVV